ncbi:hypothetical protein EW145_g6685 [Phellinidium pouzarii]|uniref:Uncharacterized protein n=1 Tax=Phellinidium pouzarii TaxID=167371 RepID=A0A4S4KXP2_9AGAM|nr:hypothetical protein EW145_g6685 [Phellinidium pouzarii]
MHIAYDGASSPFMIRSQSDLPPRLSCLSVCSPVRWQLQDHIAGTLIPYECLTHLHFICPSQSTYDFISAHAKNLTALTHLRVGITSPSPEQYAPSRQYISQLAIISLISKMGVLRTLFVRIPSLHEIVVKSDIPYPMLRHLMEPHEKTNKQELEDLAGHKRPFDPVEIWRRRACQLLDETFQRWS